MTDMMEVKFFVGLSRMGLRNKGNLPSIRKKTSGPFRIYDLGGVEIFEGGTNIRSENVGGY